MKELIRLFKFEDAVIHNDSKNLCRSRCIVSMVLGFAALLMLIINIKNHSMTMVYSSVILVVGFSISAVVAGILKKEKISAAIIALLVGLVLSSFALNGGNEGFAVLWVLMVPMFAINILGVATGLSISTYFLIFLFLLFSTPLNSVIDGKYSTAFISRFPVLYMSDYLIATYYSLQREYYQRKLKLQAYTDGLTGAYNRRYFIEYLQKTEKTGRRKYAIIMLDLNGLKKINDTLGHEAGDELIRAVVKNSKDAFDKKDIICRLGGDEFSIISFGEKADIEEKIAKLRSNEKKWKGKLVKDISFAMGMAYSEDDKDLDYSGLMQAADALMYKDKMAYYQDKEHDRRKR